MVVFYVILVVVIFIAVALCTFRLVTGFNEMYDEYRHVIETLVGIETKIDSIMKTNTAQSDWIHTCTEFLKELGSQNSHILEELQNINVHIDANTKDIIAQVNEVQQSNFEDICDNLATHTALIKESIKSSKPGRKKTTADKA